MYISYWLPGHNYNELREEHTSTSYRLILNQNYDKSRRIIHNGLLLLYATDTLHDIANVTAVKDWETSCYRLTRSVFSEAVSALYVRQYAPKYLETLVSRVILFFQSILPL